MQIMKSKKITATVLSMAMMISALPGLVYAEETEEVQEETGSVEEIQEDIEEDGSEGAETEDSETEETDEADVYKGSGITFADGTLTLSGDVNRAAIDDVVGVDQSDAVIHVVALPGTRIIPNTGWKALFEYMHNVQDIDLSKASFADDLTSLAGMFSNCSSLQTIIFPENDDTSGITDMSYMFYRCESLKSLDLVKDLDTSSVTDMKGMFGYCSSLESIEFGPKFDTSKVTSMYAMFDSCRSLTTLDLTGFKTGSVTDISFMIEFCSKLETIYFGKGFDTSSVTIAMYMFYGCEALETISAYKAFGLDPAISELMFGGCESLPGFDPDCTDGTYARENSPSGLGYLTIETSEGVLGYSLTLDNTIGINFYAYIEDDSDLSATYDWGTGTDSRTGRSYVHSDVPAVITPITDEEESALYDGANYKITCHVSARSMTDDVSLTVNSGSETLFADRYCVIEYLEDAVKLYPDNVVLHYLLNVMFIYGDQAQQYFDYNTDDPAADYLDYTGLESDPSLLSEVKALVRELANIEDEDQEIDVSDESMTVRTIDYTKYGIEYYGSSLVCTSAVKAKLYFKIVDETLADQTSIYVAPQSAAYYKLISSEKSNGYLVVSVELSSPLGFRIPVSLLFNNGNSQDILKYTISSYYKSVFSSSAGSDLKKMRDILYSMNAYMGAATLYQQS